MQLSRLCLQNLWKYVKRKLKGNLTTPSSVGFEGNKNCPWCSLFDDSILQHEMTIRKAINFKTKNPIEVLYYHKIQLRLNVSRIYTLVLVTFTNSSCEFLLESGRHKICLSRPWWTLMQQPKDRQLQQLQILFMSWWVNYRQNCLLHFSLHSTTWKRLGMHIQGQSLQNLRTCIKRELKGNLTPLSNAGYLGNKNSPWSLLLGYSILRHGVTFRVGVNFKPKNSVEVLQFHKIHVQLKVSRICTAKIQRQGNQKKTPTVRAKKEDMQQPVRSKNLVCLRRPGMGSPQHTNSK